MTFPNGGRPKPLRSRRGLLVCSYFTSLILILQCLLFAGCGGGGGSTPSRPSVASVQRALADADTQPEMEAAADRFVRATALDTPITPNLPDRKGIPEEVVEVAAAAQLEQPANQRKTIGQWFALFKGFLGADKVPMTEAEFVAGLNAEIPAAYAAPDRSSHNAMIVLLTSPPGVVGGTPPVVSASTVISPLQMLLLARYLSTAAGARFPCSLCYSQYNWTALGCFAATVLCIGATGGWLAAVCLVVEVACLGVADSQLQMCLSDCHQQ
ncbi:MAG: hypothetical protein ACO1SV_25225 [Fimbriimonas sp.]